MFLGEWKAIASEVHQLAVDKGFYDNPPSLERQLLLIMTEIDEYTIASDLAIQVMNQGCSSEMSLKTGIPLHEEELADVGLRILDTLVHQGYDFRRKSSIVFEVPTFRLLVRLYDEMRTTGQYDFDRLFAAFLTLEKQFPRLRTAMFIKHSYNKTRPHLHGKKF